MKTIRGVLILISFIVMIFMFSGSVSAANYTVNPGDNIQSVINNATNNSVITVNNNNGSKYTYNVNLILNKTVSLKATIAGLVTLQASNPSSPIININSLGSGSTIQGFTIVGDTSSDAIYLNRASNCQITSNSLNTNNEGIFLSNSKNNSILNNSITNNYYAAIWLEVNSNNNTIQNNYMTNDTRYGTYLNNCTNIIITGNSITGEQYGINPQYSSATIQLNRITGCTNFGIVQQLSSTITATNNWWGTNSPVVSTTSPSDICLQSGGGTLTYNPWLIVKLSASPTTINGNSAVTADLTHNNSGGDTSPQGNIPDNTWIYLSTNIGNIPYLNNSKKGKVIANFNRGTSTSGTATITASIDKQSVTTNIVINTSIHTIPTVSANIGSGIYNTTQSVILTATDTYDSSPVVYYSVNNGSTWTYQSNTVTIIFTQGIHSLEYYGKDGGGNNGTIVTNTYTIDTTAPWVTASLGTGIYNTTQSVVLTANDNLDTNPKIWYSINNGTTWNYQTKTVTIPFNQGITSLMFYAVNYANVTSIILTNTYTIDTTAPVMTVNLADGIYNTPQYVTLTATDNLDTAPVIYYSTDGGNTWTNSSNNNAPSNLSDSNLNINQPDLPVLPPNQTSVLLYLDEGITDLEYYAVDDAGNTCTLQSDEYTIDTTAPVMTVNLADGIYNTPQYVTLTATDNLDTAPVIYYSTDGGNTWTNSSNNNAPSNLSDSNLNINQPDLPVLPPNQTSVLLYLDEGITDLEYYAVDDAGNTCTLQSDEYTIDTTAPVMTVNLADGIYNTPQYVTLTATDNLDTAPVIYYSTDGGNTWTNSSNNNAPSNLSDSNLNINQPDLPVLPPNQTSVLLYLDEGITDLEYYAVDDAGNTCTLQSDEYTIDTTAPVMTVNLADGIYNTPQYVTLTATDNLDTAPVIYYSTDGGNTWTNSSNNNAPSNLSDSNLNINQPDLPVLPPNQTSVLLYLDEGITDLEYYAVDDAGNTCTLQSDEYTIDTTAPVMTVNLADGIYNTPQYVTLTATDNLDTAPVIYYSTDGGNTWTNSSNNNAPSNLSDSNLNINQPDLPVLPPNQTSVLLYLDEGITDLEYYAVDDAGNTCTLQSDEYTIDTTAPVMTVNLADGIYNTPQYVTLTATDNLDTAPVIYYSTDGGNTWTNSSNNNAPSNLSDSNLNINQPDLPVLPPNQTSVLLYLDEGITDLEYYAVDDAGNTCTLQSDEYTIDTTAPVMTVNLADGIYNTPQYVTLTATDNLDTAPVIYYSTDGGNTWTNSSNNNAPSNLSDSNLNINQPDLPVLPPNQTSVLLYLDEGITDLEYYAVDDAGNTCTLQSDEYTIDTTAPVMTVNLTDGI